MKYTLLLTQNCTLACTYCYIGKKDTSMSLPVAKKILEFIFSNTPAGEKIEIGFFGGEPLLEFKKIKTLTRLIKNHPEVHNHPIELQIVTNGTIFSEEIAKFTRENNIGLVISCDGPAIVQDIHRKYPGGLTSSGVVERTIREAAQLLDVFMVNAVYTPQTFHYLPETVDYLYGLGARNIFLNPDFSARWSAEDATAISGIFQEIGNHYLRWYSHDDPAIVSFIDGKISLILNQGCNNSDKCHMGTREFAFTPDGKIFPCERLVYDGEMNEHCIGTIFTGVDHQKFSSCSYFSNNIDLECLKCSLKKYCMNWCGCSNFFSTGYYNKVGPFICASEKASITTAFNVFQQLSDTYGASMIEKVFKKHFQEHRV